VYAVYVDDELPADERRAVESHLIGCRACRARVVALRDEAELLSDVLRERTLAASHSPAAAASARGVALGLGPALALSALAATVIGTLLESHLPGEILNPLRLRGVLNMVFDVILTVRDRVPGLLELTLAIAATVGISALLTFTVTSLFRRWAGPGVVGVLCLAALSAPSPSSAHFGMHEHRDVRIAADEIHEGTLVTWTGQSVNVDGVVDGDLVVIGERLAIRGEVRGNVVAFTRDLEISGTVTGALFGFGGHSGISGKVEGNLYAFTEDFRLAGEAERDLMVFASTAVVEGKVDRDVFARTDWIEVRGDVGRNLNVRSDRISLLDGSNIGGDVRARLPRGQEIERASGAQVAGEIDSQMRQHRHRGGLARYGELEFWIFIAIELAAAFLFGMLLPAVVPGVFGGHLDTAGSFFRSVGIGFVAAVASPLVIALCAITLVGIPIAAVGLALFLTSLYVSFLVMAALVGTALVRPREQATHAFGLALLAGLLVLMVGTHIPFLGGLVVLLVVLAGLGLLVDRARGAYKAAH
jgi:anti-sigma factor RsiW